MKMFVLGLGLALIMAALGSSARAQPAKSACVIMPSFERAAASGSICPVRR